MGGNNIALQTSFLLFFVAVAVWFVFFAGLRALLARSKPGLEHFGTTMFGLGAAICILTIVCLGLEAAATATAFRRPEDPPDNLAIYALFKGGSVLDGAPTTVPVAAFLTISGLALSRSRLLSSWAAWLSWGAAILVVPTLPTLYQGDALGGIFGADGLVAEVLWFIPLYVWTIAVSIGILRMPAAG